MQNVITIIPARYSSERLPGKPLADMLGRPLIIRVWERARQAVERVVVATDDDRIREVVEAYGGEAVLTSKTCLSGTDRCREAYDLIGQGEEIIVNLQGDEPFINPESISDLIDSFSDKTTDIATLSYPLPANTSFDDLSDPNRPNVTVDSRGFALLFSRSVIPHLRGVDPHEWAARHSYSKHIGVYAFRQQVLRTITDLPQSSLELAERLEQLRWLEAGYRIRVVETPSPSLGIDTPADLECAIQYLRHGHNN